MTLTTVSLWHEIDGERVADSLQETCDKLNGDAGNVSLDFSSVRRLDPGALRAMEALATLADQKSGKALDDKLAELNRGPSVEERLQALKKQLDTPAQ